MSEIVVSGYPKSGNTWLAWLLGDILDCPVGGMYAAVPLATEGRQRPKHHHVYQLHLHPEWGGGHTKAIPHAWCLHIPSWSEDEYKICVPVRDPRDVAVSIKFYWRRPSVQSALDAMIDGTHPLGVHSPWIKHVTSWMKVGVPFVRYEDLHADAENTLKNLLDGWNIKYAKHRVAEAIERQSFARKRAQIEVDGDARVYNKGIHLQNLRKGVVGDWKNHFTPAQEAQAREAFGEVAAKLGYEL